MHRFSLPALALAVAACQQQPPPKAERVPPTSSATAAPQPGAASSAAPDETSCSEPTGCGIVPAECCDCQGLGGKKPRAVSNDAYPRAMAACARTRCEPCATGHDPGPDPNFVAVCQSGKCQALDVRRLPASECKADADCFLTPPRCCGCAGEPVAVSKHGAQSLREALCGNAQCGACSIPPYQGLSAACDNGRCVRRGRWKRQGASF